MLCNVCCEAELSDYDSLTTLFLVAYLILIIMTLGSCHLCMRRGLCHAIALQWDNNLHGKMVEGDTLNNGTPKTVASTQRRIDKQATYSEELEEQKGISRLSRQYWSQAVIFLLQCLDVWVRRILIYFYVGKLDIIIVHQARVCVLKLDFILL